MMPETVEATEKATGFADYVAGSEIPESEKNAPTVTAKRKRPILCIAEHCLCAGVDEEELAAGLHRDRLPMGCAVL